MVDIVASALTTEPFRVKRIERRQQVVPQPRMRGSGYDRLGALFLLDLADSDHPTRQQLLEADNWFLAKTRGSHRQFKHPTKPGGERLLASCQTTCTRRLGQASFDRQD
jgi:hypothetical protein